MIGHCKLCFIEIENDNEAYQHFKVYHKIFNHDVMSIEELIQD